MHLLIFGEWEKIWRTGGVCCYGLSCCLFTATAFHAHDTRRWSRSDCITVSNKATLSLPRERRGASVATHYTMLARVAARATSLLPRGEHLPGLAAAVATAGLGATVASQPFFDSRAPDALSACAFSKKKNRAHRR